MPTKSSGKGSKTAYYSFYNISEQNLSTLSRHLQYTPCSEIKNAKYVSWIPRGNSAFALSITASKPKDPNRTLNQTVDGQPLNFNKAIKMDPDLWIQCDEEEWHRLLENTLIPVRLSEIPKNNNITYYNRQIKEKLKVIDDVEYVHARVRGTLGGDKINYEGLTSTHKAEYFLIKTLFSAVLHDVKYVDPETRFYNIDLVDFYLQSPMETPAYISVPLKDIPRAIIDTYGVYRRPSNSNAYFKVVTTMYGIVRNDLLPAINEISSTQSAPTLKTMQQVDSLSNYSARFPKGSVIYKATGMILKAMYDSALRPHGKHKIGSLIYHSNEDDTPEIIGNIIEVLCKLPPDVVASIAEGEYCFQFITCKAAYWHRIINERM